MVYLKEPDAGLDAQLFVVPFPGWLVQERDWYTMHSEQPGIRRANPPPQSLPERRVVPGEQCSSVGEEGVIEPTSQVDGDAAFWKLLAPGEDPPDSRQIELRLGQLEQHEQNRQRRVDRTASKGLFARARGQTPSPSSDLVVDSYEHTGRPCTVTPNTPDSTAGMRPDLFGGIRHSADVSTQYCGPG